jgi:hypothetical protein
MFSWSSTRWEHPPWLKLHAIFVVKSNLHMHCKNNYIQILLTPKLKYNGWTREPKLGLKFFKQSMPLHHNDIWVQICFFLVTWGNAWGISFLFSHRPLYLPFDIPILITIVSLGQNFTKFQPEKYDFWPIWRISYEKNGPNLPNLKFFYMKITRWT